ncbi:MAG: hypothetical protein HFE63_00285 [Clostridiales bacterium]|nr:hypothetical protein [Clostridiales bacterium]
MSAKTVGITKAAIAGAVFGSAVGLFSIPNNKKSKKHSVMSDVSGTLRIVGTAMQDVSKLISKK